MCGIAGIVDRDLDIVRRLARLLERNTDWGRSMGVRALADGFADAMREELDFTVEAGNMTTVAAGQSIANSNDLVVPELYPKLSTRRVLTMQRLDGIGLGGAAQAIADRGLDAARLGRSLFDCLLGQVAIEGVFHADPHPGNFLLLTDGRIGMLDLGSVGRLDAAQARRRPSRRVGPGGDGSTPWRVPAAACAPSSTPASPSHRGDQKRDG